MKHALGVLAGLVAGIVVIFAIEAISSRIYPMPSGLDPSDATAMSKAIAAMPLGAFVLVLAGWFAGTLGGMLLAAHITHGTVAPLIVALLLVTGAVLTMVQIRHPLWFMVAAGVVFAGTIAGGLRLAPARAAD